MPTGFGPNANILFITAALPTPPSSRGDGQVSDPPHLGLTGPIVGAPTAVIDDMLHQPMSANTGMLLLG
jgi:hypothetical protein